jgi:hypothetical protein
MLVVDSPIRRTHDTALVLPYIGNSCSSIYVLVVSVMCDCYPVVVLRAISYVFWKQFYVLQFMLQFSVMLANERHAVLFYANIFHYSNVLVRSGCT